MAIRKSARRNLAARLFGYTALATTAMAGNAFAQASADDGATLTEVVVTAQKREQNLQDVPIAVTALTQETLQANRISNVNDLNNLVPNLSVRTTAGGIGIPSFTMRGITSYGVVAGSDKEISIYVDGVYIGATRGSVFDFPELDRIEVLRGPQGTLFGRNATAGAVNIVTRNPPGRFGVQQQFTYGNYRQFRSKTRIDLPQWGPFTGSVTYLHEERRGDMKNLGAGTVWHRPGIGDGISPDLVSPKYLGNKDLDSFFVTVQFKPSDDFTLTYKFDHDINHSTPEGVAPIGVGPVLSGLVAAQTASIPFASDARRIKAVNNWWTTPGRSAASGHSLTAEWRINDKLSVKNIFAYRDSKVFATFQYDGLGGLRLTSAFLPTYAALAGVPAAGIPAFVAGLAPLVGSPFIGLGLLNLSKANQWSNEAQVNYDSKLVTLTAGALYFNIHAFAGQPVGYEAPIQFTPVPGFTMPAGPNSFQNYNYSESKAVYAQAEVHATPQLDLVGGYRLTHDSKSGSFLGLRRLGIPVFQFKYNKTKPTYTLGVNYKPVDTTLLYAKYSTGFVSGGAIGSLPWLPETAHSWEGGVKADLFNRRLRTNLTVFHVKYANIQRADSGFRVGHPELPTIIVELGDAKAKGFEFEGSAAPIRNLVVGGSLGYTNFKYTRFSSTVRSLYPADLSPTLLPKWTAALYADYTTEPVFKEAELRFRLDAGWHSKVRYLQTFDIFPFSQVFEFGPASWSVNGRVALQHIKAWNGDVEVALWGKNLTNSREPNFGNGALPLFVSTSFMPARTVGIDLTFNY